MATRKIIGKFELTGVDHANVKISELEKSLEEAREAIKGVAIGSKDFERLAQHIQETESRVKTLNKQMEGLEPQQKAEAFLKMGEGIAGGFAVAQGAMALLGLESENLEKLQTGVQSAISIAMGVRMISEGALNVAIAKRVATEKIGIATTSLYAKVNKVATVSAKTFKKALIGLGIGAIVTLVTTLVVKIQEWTKENNKNERSAKKLKEEYEKVTTTSQDYIRELDRIINLNKQLSRAETDLEKDLIRTNDALAQSELRLAEHNTKSKELQEELKGLKRRHKDRRAEVEKEIATLTRLIEHETQNIINHKTVASAIDDMIFKQKEQEQVRQKNHQNQQKRNQQEEAERKRKEDLQLRGQRRMIELSRELAIQSLEDEDAIALLKLQHQEEDELASAMQFENFEILKTQITQKYANLRGDIEKRVDEKTVQNKLDLERSRLQQIGIALGGLSGMFAEGTKQFKALKIAEAMINMQMAISNANTASFDMFKNATFFGYPAAMVMRAAMIASAIATGVSTIRRIQETPVPEDLVPVRVFARGGAIGGYGTGTTDNVPILASPGEVVINSRSAQMYKPLLSSINMAGGGVGFAEGGQIGGYDMPDMSNQIVKAYVVTDEMTESQDMLAKIRKRATL